jgi:hypothetical protein
MSTWTMVCGEYRQLLEELRTAVQLCAEYESPFVHPIDSRKLTPERAGQLRDGQSDRKIESKVASLFTGLRACFACARHKPSNEQIPSHKYAEGVRCSRLRV